MFESETQLTRLKRIILTVVAIALMVLAWPSCQGPPSESVREETPHWGNYRGCYVEEVDVVALAALVVNLVQYYATYLSTPFWIWKSQ